MPSEAEIEAAHAYFVEHGEWVPPRPVLRAALSAASAVRSEPVGFATSAGLEGLLNGEMQAVMPVRLAEAYKRDVGPVTFLYTAHVQTREAGLREAQAIAKKSYPHGAAVTIWHEIEALLSQPEPRGDKA